MAKQLITDNIKSIIEKLIQNGFVGNRTYDRIYSWCEVKGLPNLADWFHLQAHEKANVDADKFIEYMHKRNTMVNFLQTPQDDTEYATLGEVIENLIEYESQCERDLVESAKIAWSESDLQSFSIIQEMIVHQKEHINLISILSDTIELYGDEPKSWLSMDSRLNRILRLSDEKDDD